MTVSYDEPVEGIGLRCTSGVCAPCGSSEIPRSRAVCVPVRGRRGRREKRFVNDGILSLRDMRNGVERRLPFCHESCCRTGNLITYSRGHECRIDPMISIDVITAFVLSPRVAPGRAERDRVGIQSLVHQLLAGRVSTRIR